jgi:hypothetical protein
VVIGTSCLTGIIACQTGKENLAQTLSDFDPNSHVVHPTDYASSLHRQLRSIISIISKWKSTCGAWNFFPFFVGILASKKKRRRPMSPLRLLAFVLFLTLVLPPLCHADEFRYDFTAIDTPIFGSYGWTFDNPNILQTTTTITDFLGTFAPSGCTINSVVVTNPGTEFNFNTSFGGFGGGCPGPAQDIVSSLFPGITVPGLYVVTIDSATWRLSLVEIHNAVPEPSSLLLAGVGIGALGLVRRKLLG